MKQTIQSRQRGLGMLGFLVVAMVLAVAGVVVAQVVPTLIEFQAIQKAVQRAAGGQSVAEIRQLFDKQAQVDDIKSISGKDVLISKEGETTVVSFSYQREIHLAGPAYLTLKYAGRSQ